MKLRRNLKLFFTGTIISAGAVIVFSYSMLAARYLEEGLDSGMRITMMEIGRNTSSLNNQVINVLGFEVTDSWQNVSPAIRKTFSQPKEHMELKKHLDNSNWFTLPQKALFVMSYQNNDSNIYYISRVIDNNYLSEVKQDLPSEEVPYVFTLLIFAAIAITLFAFSMYLIVRQVAIPVERLYNWARQLSASQLKEATPDFRYNELNRLAVVISKSLSSVEDTLSREQKFLAHASHELRTPITVIRSNTELALKLVDNPRMQAKNKEVLSRIARASLTMTDLTETLLWLHQGRLRDIQLKPVDLKKIIDNTCNDLKYLLQGKEIEIEHHLTPGIFLLPETLCRIVVSNLVRNAYQHTLVGKITINLEATKFSISNRDYSGCKTQNMLGFGLGLELTNRIIDDCQWTSSIEEYDQGRIVTVDFFSLNNQN